jgi:hypothetical protein
MTTKNITQDLILLCKYASDSNFIIETGAGKSTEWLYRVAKKNNSLMFTIEIDKKICYLVDGNNYRCGWSVSYKDLLKSYPLLKSSLKKYTYKTRKHIDGRIAKGEEKLMKGDKDIIRKILKENRDIELDFFFCDSGEYCGLAEWNIVKNEIKVGGYFAIHDIYYPKSIKGFKVRKIIKKSDRWKILEQSKTIQGLLIAQRIK